MMGGSCTTYYVHIAAFGGPDGVGSVLAIALRFGLVVVLAFLSGTSAIGFCKTNVGDTLACLRRFTPEP